MQEAYYPRRTTVLALCGGGVGGGEGTSHSFLPWPGQRYLPSPSQLGAPSASGIPKKRREGLPVLKKSWTLSRYQQQSSGCSVYILLPTGTVSVLGGLLLSAGNAP